MQYVYTIIVWGSFMTSKELIKRLQQDGWIIDRVHGSHHIMKKGAQTEVIPHHNKELPTGLVQAILKRTGLK